MLCIKIELLEDVKIDEVTFKKGSIAKANGTRIRFDKKDISGIVFEEGEDAMFDIDLLERFPKTSYSTSEK